MNGRRRTLLAAMAVVAIPALLFIDVIAGRGVFYVRDVAFYHFPMKRIAREIMLRGEFPFWNSWISAGQPLAANPAHQIFYPLNALILLPDYVYWFQILALLHVAIAALSTFALLRSMRLSRAAAVVGGLSFAMGGVILSTLNLFPFLFSSAWMPLTFLFARRYLLERRPRDLLLAAGSLAVQCLIGEPVMLIQTGLVLGIYALACGFEERSWRRAVVHVGVVAAITALALLLSAVQTLPAIDHARDSVRVDGFELKTVSTWSTPPLRALELLNPDLFGSRHFDRADPSWEGSFYSEGLPYLLSIYSGVLVLILSLCGVLGCTRGSGLYLAIAVPSALLAAGSHTPLFDILFESGVIRSIRFPEKFVIVATFASVVFACVVLDRILAGDSHLRRLAIAVASVMALAALAAAVALTAPDGQEAFRRFLEIPSDEHAARVIAQARSDWFIAALRSTGALLLLVAVRFVRRPLASAMIVAFVVADLSAEAGDTAPRTSRHFYTSPPPAIAELPLHRNDYRVFLIGNAHKRSINRREYLEPREHRALIQRNALAGYAHATYGIRAALQTDIDLTSLRASADFMRSVWDLGNRTPEWLDYATAMSNIWYLGVYRPFDEAVAASGGDARWIEPIRWIERQPHPRYYFASELVPVSSREDFVGKVASGRHARDAAFVLASSAVRLAPGKVTRTIESANGVSLDVKTAGAAFLVMSVTHHKYWTVTIDGDEVPVVPTNVGYQGVLVPPGTHTVSMRYHNPLIAAGGAASIATLAALIVFARRRSRASTMRAL